jgi:hypothetical protein
MSCMIPLHARISAGALFILETQLLRLFHDMRRYHLSV